MTARIGKAGDLYHLIWPDLSLYSTGKLKAERFHTGPSMPHSFKLIKLLRIQIAQLEKLRQLEVRLSLADSQAKREIDAGIDKIMEEIAESTRAIRDLKSGQEPVHPALAGDDRYFSATDRALRTSRAAGFGVSASVGMK